MDEVQTESAQESLLVRISSANPRWPDIPHLHWVVLLAGLVRETDYNPAVVVAVVGVLTPRDTMEGGQGADYGTAGRLDSPSYSLLCQGGSRRMTLLVLKDVGLMLATTRVPYLLDFICMG